MQKKRGIESFRMQEGMIKKYKGWRDKGTAEITGNQICKMLRRKSQNMLTSAFVVLYLISL